MSEEKKKKTVVFRVTEDDAAFIKEHAEKHGLSGVDALEAILAEARQRPQRTASAASKGIRLSEDALGFIKSYGERRKLNASDAAESLIGVARSRLNALSNYAAKTAKPKKQRKAKAEAPADA